MSDSIVLEEKLQTIFANVNEWLKFAEAKNAALLALNSAAIFGVVQLLNVDKPLSSLIRMYFIEFIACAALALILSLLSFLPMLIIFMGQPQPINQTDNVIYFGHIARHTPQSYLTKVRETYNVRTEPQLQIELHFAEQIVINSQITLRKYRYFHAAASLTFIAVVSVPLALLFYIGLWIWKSMK